MEFHQSPKNYLCLGTYEAVGRAGARPTEKSKLLDDLAHNAGTNGSAAFADSEAQTLFAGDRSDKLNSEGDVVAGTAHLNTLRKLDNTGNVGGSEIELRSVTGNEGFLASAFFFGQNVYLTHELGVRMNRSGLAQNLSALDLVLGNAAEQSTDVVTGLSLRKELVEHLDAGYDDGALFIGQTDDLNGIANLNSTTLNTTGSDGAAS